MFSLFSNMSLWRWQHTTRTGCDVLLIRGNWGYCYSYHHGLWSRLWDFCCHFFGQRVEMSFAPAHLAIRRWHDVTPFTVLSLNSGVCLQLWKVNLVTGSQGGQIMNSMTWIIVLFLPLLEFRVLLVKTFWCNHLRFQLAVMYWYHRTQVSWHKKLCGAISLFQRCWTACQ